MLPQYPHNLYSRDVATYILHEMFERDTTEEGSPFQIGGRTRWKTTLEVNQISVGGSITVILEVSPNAEEDTYTELVAFGAQSAVGETLKDSTKLPTPDFTVALSDIWMRARITAITGTVSIRVVAVSPFLDMDVPGDRNLLSLELRDFSEAPRLVEQAEWDLVETLLLNADSGLLNIDLRPPGANRAMRLEISRQADHILRRENLGRSEEPSTIETLDRMPVLISGLGDRLEKYQPAGANVWYGR